ncbi:MAG: hypothetical protein OEW92_03460 [Gammaproteobacteria bacterium]|jgi:hypothetical protein|nr:hypothetical protein [Gammaproteobacteria bacterium]
MASFEQEFYLENPGRWQVLRRDVRLLLRLASYALLWLTRGVLVRRAYRRAQRNGKPLELESVIGD